jgi:hypothetical protein
MVRLPRHFQCGEAAGADPGPAIAVTDPLPLHSLQPDRFLTQIRNLQSLEYLSLAGCSLLSLSAFFALPVIFRRQLLDLNLDRHNDAAAARPILSVEDILHLRRIAPL